MGQVSRAGGARVQGPLDPSGGRWPAIQPADGSTRAPTFVAASSLAAAAPARLPGIAGDERAEKPLDAALRPQSSLIQWGASRRTRQDRCQIDRRAATRDAHRSGRRGSVVVSAGPFPNQLSVGFDLLLRSVCSSSSAFRNFCRSSGVGSIVLTTGFTQGFFSGNAVLPR